MPTKGGRRRKTRTHVVGPPSGAVGAPDTEMTEKVPKSFVLKKGKVHSNVSDLAEEMRRVMEPHTARKLRERAKNTVKDYVSVSSVLGVTHLLVFTQTDKSLSLRVCRTPTGPTLTFKVQQFSLMRHVRALQKRPVEVNQAYKTSPLVVLNNFGDKQASSHVKLMKVTLQNMFPSINVATVKLQDCRRVVMFNLDKTNGTVEMRHFAVRATPTGITKAIKKVVQAKVPDLHGLEDISEYVAGGMGGGLSDSEVEDEESKITLPDDYVGRGNVKSQKRRDQVPELGPRLTLELMKVERGLCEGEVLYHSYVTKTAEEIKAQRAKVEKRDCLKRKRREEQAENVARKKQEAEELAAAKAARRLERAQQAAAEGDADEEGSESDGESGEEQTVGSYVGDTIWRWRRSCLSVLFSHARPCLVVAIVRHPIAVQVPNTEHQATTV
ncbi:unnamed protein product [Ectocarpus sp. 13 AM-2016]